MPTISGSVIANAQRVPDVEALVCADRRWTWRELDREIARWAGLWATMRLSHGDRLALMSNNTPELVIAILSALRLGAVVVPVNAHLTAPEVRHILRDCGSLLIATAPECRRVMDDAIRGEDALAEVLPVVELKPGLADGVPAASEDRAGEDDDAFIIYTSGTTGAPQRGSARSSPCGVGCTVADHKPRTPRFGPISAPLAAPPLRRGGLPQRNHAAGGYARPRARVRGRCRARVARERAHQLLLGVPTTIQFLLRHPDFPKRDLSCLRVLVFGAAPMPADTIEELIQLLPTVYIVQLCGQTEAGPTGLYSTTEQLRARPDSTGHQGQPGVAARVVDAHEMDVAPGEVGELLFQGEGVMKGYWGDPKATAAALRGGWLHTGDLVLLHQDGSMTLVDRIKDLIITGGQNVYSAEVEQALATHPAILDCAVLGRPHAEYGQTVIAVVALHSGCSLTLQELREYCSHRLAHYKIPRRLVVGEVVRNASGKIQKHRMTQI